MKHSLSVSMTPTSVLSNHQLAVPGEVRARRVAELRELRHFERADAVEMCGIDAFCGRRACPECCLAVVESARLRVEDGLLRMRSAVHVRISAEPSGTQRMAHVWANVRRALHDQVRPGYLRALVRVVGCIRIEERRRGRAAVVVDLAIETSRPFDFDRFNRNWRRFAACGKATCERLGDHSRVSKRFARKFTTQHAWFPRPNDVSLERLSEIMSAQHRRRLVFVWAPLQQREERK